MAKKTTPLAEPQKPSLVIARSKADAQIKEQIEKLKKLLAESNIEQARTTLDKYADYNKELLGQMFDNDAIPREYRGVINNAWNIQHAGYTWGRDAEPEADKFRREVQEHIKVLESIYQRLELIPEPPKVSTYEESSQASDKDTPSLLLPIFKRFHQLARQIRKRHDNRPTLEVGDEYDVQDFLHVLLKLYFDDIRPEEWTPSYAGSSSKMDFLLKKEQTVIETKKTRKGLADREVGDQLIIDIQKYRTHPDCKSLICFVYDPEGKIANPKALETDLSKSENDFKVTVIIEPK
jgi:hypothetical protein